MAYRLCGRPPLLCVSLGTTALTRTAPTLPHSPRSAHPQLRASRSGAKCWRPSLPASARVTRPAVWSICSMFGKFCAAQGMYEPTVCKAGWYCPPGGLQQLPCPAGHYCPLGSWSPLPWCVAHTCVTQLVVVVVVLPAGSGAAGTAGAGADAGADLHPLVCRLRAVARSHRAQPAHHAGCCTLRCSLWCCWTWLFVLSSSSRPAVVSMRSVSRGQLLMRSTR